MIQWRPFDSGIRIGGKAFPLKTLRLVDARDSLRRYRVSIIQNPYPPFSSGKAFGRLAKDSQGRIGVIISGLYGGFVRVGKNNFPSPYLFVSFNTLSKMVRTKLLRQIKVELFEDGGVTFAREEED